MRCVRFIGLPFGIVTRTCTERRRKSAAWLKSWDTIQARSRSGGHDQSAGPSQALGASEFRGTTWLTACIQSGPESRTDARNLAVSESASDRTPVRSRQVPAEDFIPRSTIDQATASSGEAVRHFLPCITAQAATDPPEPALRQQPDVTLSTADGAQACAAWGCGSPNQVPSASGRWS